jgi:hypothetical protein
MKPSNSVIMALFKDQYQGKTKTATLHTGLLAEVAELVDALDSKSSDGNIMGVRFPPSAPSSFFSTFYKTIQQPWNHFCKRFMCYCGGTNKNLQQTVNLREKTQKIVLTPHEPF